MDCPWIQIYIYIQGRRNRGGHRGQGPPIFCALALVAASHVRTTRNATGDLYLRRHNCPKCPQNAPKNCLKSQILWGACHQTPLDWPLCGLSWPPHSFSSSYTPELYQRNAPANSSKRGSLRLAPIMASLTKWCY